MFKEIRNKTYNAIIYNEDYDDLEQDLDEIEEMLKRPEFIIQWFESPFISEYDKSKVKEFLKSKI